MADPLLLSVSEAAKRLGLGEGTVRDLIRCHKLGSVSIGKRNRKIPVGALEDYIRSQTEGGSS